MIKAVEQLIRTADDVVARGALLLRPERHALITLLFHSLFRDQAEIDHSPIDPLQRTTVDTFRAVIEYFVARDYQFVGPDDILNGLSPDRNYIHLTFDDGYFNNHLALPVLELFKVPAVFFISTNHVSHNKCFWWDVLHRELAQTGASSGEIYNEALALKHQTTAEIEETLTGRFGPQALRPRGGTDRPFSPAELRSFASSPYVFLGNHTADHAILLNYSPQAVREQVAQAQDALVEMTGVTPNAIAYPNGAFNNEILSTCQDLGLRLGYTTRPEKATAVSTRDPTSRLTIGRFAPVGTRPAAAQGRSFRNDLNLYSALRNTYVRVCRRGVSR